MNRREFLYKTAAAAVGAATYGHAEAATDQDKGKRRQPNVLYVFSDQHRAVSLPGEPFNQAIAPNLDAFRRSNFAMETCVSNYPLCTPYRGILMTGRWPYQTGLIRNNIALGTHEVSLGNSFKNAGYHTGYVGKWHLSTARMMSFIPKGPGSPGVRGLARLERHEQALPGVDLRPGHGRERSSPRAGTARR